jgi:CHAD domain-containing protein
MATTSSERVRKLRASKSKVEIYLDEREAAVLAECAEMAGGLPDAAVLRRALMAYHSHLTSERIAKLIG